MTLNDYYYETVAKQHAAELQAIAADDRLAKIARQADKQKRADQREARRLQAAVNGRRGPWQVLRALLVPAEPATDRGETATTQAATTQAGTTDQPEETAAPNPAPAASR